jgi:general secretion pathway protein F/type IV pilus assembly protein PilC
MLGGNISEALKAEALYPVLVVRMVNIGENSGTLDNQFTFLAEHYRAKLNNLTANLGKVVEPLIIIGVGLIFAVIILGLMLPIYDLVSKVGGGGRL